MKFRFTLRAMFVLMTVASVILAVYAHHLDVQQKRLVAMARVHANGGFVVFRSDDGSIPYPVNERVRRTATVDSVYLASTVLDTDTLTMLDRLKELRMLSFNSTSFSDDHLRYLDELSHLRELQLNGTDVTDDGIAYLVQTHSLTSLTLNDTHITDRAASHLATMSTLTKLHLRHTRLTDNAVRLLKKALPQCQIHHTPAT